MDILELEVLGLEVPAHQVDDHVRVLDCVTNGGGILQVVEVKEYLAKITGDLKTDNIRIVTAIGQDHLGARFAQFVADIAAHETGGTENGRHDPIETATSASSALHGSRIGGLQWTWTIFRRRSSGGISTQAQNSNHATAVVL